MTWPTALLVKVAALFFYKLPFIVEFSTAIN